MDLNYPQILKSSDWQKEKSIIAKVLPGKKTGIAEALQECEKLYPGIKTAMAPLPNGTKVPPALKPSLAQFGLKVQHARDLAKEAADKWKAKTSPVPKATRIHAENIERAADQFFKQIEHMM
ncbi:MAG TPA: hypothetical protein VMB03_00895 [Bryobacteraceae bacterium]|nr:hypothetical protein [Bryobacteraceae bacterium]